MSAIDAEAAALLRPFVEPLAELQFTRRFPDEDVAGTLLRAAQKLGHLEDSAASLGRAADRAAAVEDVAGALEDVTRDLRALLDGFDAVESLLRRFQSEL